MNSDLDPAVDGLAHAVRSLLQQLRFALTAIVQFLRIYPVADELVSHGLCHAF